MTVVRSEKGSSAPDVTWKALAALLSKLRYGQLNVTIDEQTYTFGAGTESGLLAEITVLNKAVFKEVLIGGSLAAAEGYMKDFWDSPDITKVVRLFALNMNESSGETFRPLTFVAKVLRGMSHWLNHNSVSGSKKNIRAHYDLGNDLFTSFLDESMMYSSAIYPKVNSTLEEAQQHRLDRVCKKLHLDETNHLLEIGTGWGSMAIHAAKFYGCKVTTTTISDEQYHYARRKIGEQGLEDRITLLKQDYRDLSGQFDRFVSLEMIEAVGHRYLPVYFKKIDQLLSPDGIGLLQSITIRDQNYSVYTSSVDFIRKYIFPGGHLPSISIIHQQIAEQTQMVVNHFEDITAHYARTLADWHKRFVENYHTLPQDKYDRQFFRMWRYYFAYCEGGFAERSIGASQLVFSKSRAQKNWLMG